jgi:multicomponent Na+:H+ antiporter subunit F
MSNLFWLSAALIFLATLLCFLRMIIGPSLPDRVVALDLLTNLLMAFIAMFSIYSHQDIYLDIIVAMALVMFITSTMYAYYLDKKDYVKERKDG